MDSNVKRTVLHEGEVVRHVLLEYADRIEFAIEVESAQDHVYTDSKTKEFTVRPKGTVLQTTVYSLPRGTVKALVAALTEGGIDHGR